MENVTRKAHYLVRSHNSALRNNPIHGSYTEQEKAMEAVQLLSDAELAHGTEIWGPIHAHGFISSFYVETVEVNTPVEELVAQFKARISSSS